MRGIFRMHFGMGRQRPTLKMEICNMKDFTTKGLELGSQLYTMKMEVKDTKDNF